MRDRTSLQRKLARICRIAAIGAASIISTIDIAGEGFMPRDLENRMGRKFLIACACLGLLLAGCNSDTAEGPLDTSRLPRVSGAKEFTRAHRPRFSRRLSRSRRPPIASKKH